MKGLMSTDIAWACLSPSSILRSSFQALGYIGRTLRTQKRMWSTPYKYLQPRTLQHNVQHKHVMTPQLYGRSPKVGNTVASILQNNVWETPALFGLNPASNFVGFTVKSNSLDSQNNPQPYISRTLQPLTLNALSPTNPKPKA